jgi:hypothetical protein
MNTTVSDSLTWAATAEVEPNSGNDLLGDASGAYVPVVGVAGSREAFEAAIGRAMGALDFRLIDIDDVRQLATSEVANLDGVLASRVHLLGPDNPIELGSFHAFR